MWEKIPFLIIRTTNDECFFHTSLDLEATVYYKYVSKGFDEYLKSIIYVYVWPYCRYKKGERIELASFMEYCKPGCPVDLLAAEHAVVEGGRQWLRHKLKHVEAAE